LADVFVVIVLLEAVLAVMVVVLVLVVLVVVVVVVVVEVLVEVMLSSDPVNNNPTLFKISSLRPATDCVLNSASACSLVFSPFT